MYRIRFLIHSSITCIHQCTYACCIREYAHAHIYTCMHAYIHANTRTTYIHTYIRTYIHCNTQARTLIITDSMTYISSKQADWLTVRLHNYIFLYMMVTDSMTCISSKLTVRHCCCYVFCV